MTSCSQTRLCDVGRGHSCTAAVCVTTGGVWPPGSAARLPLAAAAVFERLANVNRSQQGLVLGLSFARLLPPWGRSRIRAGRDRRRERWAARAAGVLPEPPAGTPTASAPTEPEGHSIWGLWSQHPSPTPTSASALTRGASRPSRFVLGLRCHGSQRPSRGHAQHPEDKGFQGLCVTAATPPRARSPAQLDSVREGRASP